MNDDHTSALERPHVLVVSDDQGLAEFLSDGLIIGGFWTSTVASGIQALEVFRLRSFDVVVIDAALPGLSAMSVVRRLRGAVGSDTGITPRTDVPIVVIAAEAAEAPRADVLDAGADERWLAPLEIEQVVLGLHSIVAEWRGRHPGRLLADAAALNPLTSNGQ